MLQKIFDLFNKWFWPIAVLLHLAYFFQAWFSASIYLVDSIDYLSQAENFKNYGSLYAAPWNAPIKPDFFTFRPPLYGWFILVVKSIVASDYAVLLLQSVLSLVSLKSILQFLSKQNIETSFIKSGLLLILIAYPSHLIHCNFIMSDILFQFIMLQAFIYSYYSFSEANLKHTSLAAIFFVLAMLTKPVAFLLGFSIALILLIVYIRKKQAKLLLPFLLLPITYHSYCSYNQYITGYYHYSSVSPYFVLKYMAKYTNAQVYGEAYADRVQDSVMQLANAAPNHTERYRIMNDAGKTFIAQHPFVFLKFNIKGWFAFMLDPGRFDWVHFLNINEGNFLGLYHTINTKGLVNGLIEFLNHAPLQLLAILFYSLIFNIIMAYCFIAFLFSQKHNGFLKLLIFLFVSYIIGSTGILGLARYRIGIAPMIWMAAIIYIYSIWNEKRNQLS
ncbi:MAG: hypothetical protein ACOVP1_03365 [Bacteroidia bacterium]